MQLRFVSKVYIDFVQRVLMIPATKLTILLFDASDFSILSEKGVIIP